MSWEVSIMPSKSSFFNKTLFRKNLSRFWPLWGGLSLVGAMFPLYMALFLMQVQRPAEDFSDGFFAEVLYTVATATVPAITCIYAIFCAMAVWGYLNNARSTGMMHALPADRTCLFVTNALSGLAMALIPYAVTGGLMCLVALGWGFFDLVAVVNTVVTVLMITLLFFGMATLCAMLTGHTFALPVFYLLANFLAYFLEMMTTGLACEFLLGVRSNRETGYLGFLSPVVQIYSSFRPHIERAQDGSGTLISCRLAGLWVVALYALAGAAMLALAWFLYQKRHSESAGDVVAFQWLRPVFRYGSALLGGLTVGRLLFEVFWETLFQRGYSGDRIPLWVCLFLGGLLGYYIASMLLEKSLRVFRRSWRGALLVAAGAAAVCLLVSVDVFGLERKVPALEDIESVAITDRGVGSGPYTMEEQPEIVEKLRQFHQSIVDDRDYVRTYVPDWEYDEGKAFSHFVRLTYYLTDGSTLERDYDLWLTRERLDTPGTYDNLLSEFYKDPVVRARDVQIPDGAELDSIDVYCDYAESSDYYVNSADHAEGDNRETRQIYAALQKDAQEGNVPAKDILKTYSSWRGSFYLQLNYFSSSAENGVRYGGSRDIYLAPSMTNTIDALVELGYVTRTEIGQWEQETAEVESEPEEAVRAEGNTVIP